MSKDHLLLRCVGVALIALGASFLSSRVEGLAMLPRTETIRAERVCAHATGVELGRTVTYCFDPARLVTASFLPFQ